jgi:hypothetical protein
MNTIYEEVIIKARHYYEIFNRLDEGTSDLEIIENSCAGIVGWSQSSNKIKLPIEEKINIFLNYINDTGYVIKKNSDIKFSDGYSMGDFWFYCKLKNKLSKTPYNKLLDNVILKKDYDKNLFLKDKINLFFEEVNYLGKIDDNMYFSDGSKMDVFWLNCKKKEKLKNYPYKKLLSVLILNDDYIKYLIKKNNKNVLSISKKIEIFLKEINETGSIPLKDDYILFSDGECMHLFWLNCKIKNMFNVRVYKKLLENTILKNDYENFLNNKYKIEIIQKAKKNYEKFYNLPQDTSLLHSINISSAGIIGWAKS